jgi:hypothetical protein
MVLGEPVDLGEIMTANPKREVAFRRSRHILHCPIALH